MSEGPRALPRDEISRIRVGRHELRVSVRGAGRPLLLINGIGAPLDLFERLQVALDAHGPRRTVSFDAPGVGGSSTPRWPPTMAELADTLAQLLDALDEGPVDALGVSWGGALAQELALRHPDCVRRLVLVATMHGATSLPGHPLAIATLATPWRYYSPAFLEAVAPVLYGGEIRRRPHLLRDHTRLRREHPPSPLGYSWQLAAITGWTSLPRLRSLAPPTLVLAGDDDPIIPLVNATTLARLIPRAALRVLEGAGHLFVYTRAIETAALVASFLDSDGIPPPP